MNGISIGNVEQLVQSIQSEKSEWTECFDEIVDDYAFTLFNCLVCMKVLEAHGLYPEMITQRQQHYGKSYAHYMWLENNQQYKDKAYELYGNQICHDTDRSFAVWFDKEGCKYIELKEIKPIKSNTYDDYELNVKILYGDEED